jgi:DNA-binding LytR/AlgR family response regulator
MSQTKDGFVYLPSTARGWIVRVSEIHRLEAYGNYTRVILSNGKIALVRRPLKECEEQLSQTGSFFRTDRACIVNLASVTETRPADPKRLLFILADGKQITLSRHQTIALRKELSL